MPIRFGSVALLRHLGRPRAAPSLTTAAAAAATAPPFFATTPGATLGRELRLHMEIVKVEAKVDESRKLYNRFSRRIFPAVIGVLMLVEWNQDASIKELKKSVAMLKEEKEKEKAASATTASSSAIPALKPEPTVANGKSCMGGST